MTTNDDGNPILRADQAATLLIDLKTAVAGMPAADRCKLEITCDQVEEFIEFLDKAEKAELQETLKFFHKLKSEAKQ